MRTCNPLLGYHTPACTCPHAGIATIKVSGGGAKAIGWLASAGISPRPASPVLQIKGSDGGDEGAVAEGVEEEQPCANYECVDEESEEEEQEASCAGGCAYDGDNGDDTTSAERV